MSKQKKKYPKVLYVVREDDSDGTEYFVPHVRPSGAAEISTDVEVAVYRLDRVAKVKTKAELVG